MVFTTVPEQSRHRRHSINPWFIDSLVVICHLLTVSCLLRSEEEGVRVPQLSGCL